MAVYAILVATALCGIAAPVYALNGRKAMSNRIFASTVGTKYKAFSGDTFYVAGYDTTYRPSFTTRALRLSRLEAISYTSGGTAPTMDT